MARALFRIGAVCLAVFLLRTSGMSAQPALPTTGGAAFQIELPKESGPAVAGESIASDPSGGFTAEWRIGHWRDPGPEMEPSGLAIEVIDLPGYERGQLFLNGTPLPGGRSDDIAFITYVVRVSDTPASQDSGTALAIRDQGRIWGADGTITLTSETLAQSVTMGASGQLSAIKMRWNGEFPEPVPLLNLAILTGGEPASWKTVHMAQVPASDIPAEDAGIFTWQLSEADLNFREGEQFTFTLSLESGVREAQVVSVVEMGILEDDPAVGARDCGYSARFQGKSVWWFGDTFLKTPNAGDERMLCNTWSATFDLDVADGLHGLQSPVDQVGSPTPLIPHTAAETAFNISHSGDKCDEEPCGARWAIWPGAMAVDENGDVAYLFYHKVYAENGEFAFTHVGHSVAVWKGIDQPATRPEFGIYDEYPTLLFAEKRDGFGSAALLVDSNLYTYGCEKQPGDIMKPCVLARVAVKKILDRSAWEYYQGDGLWSGRLDSAATVFRGNNMMSVFYNEYLSRYVAVYSQPLSTRVMLRTARAPEGPWSRPVELFTAEAGKGFKGWIYDALAHPELSADGGRTIYVTYSRQTAPMSSELRLVAVEVGLMPGVASAGSAATKWR